SMDRPMTLEELAAKVGMTPTTVSQHLRYLSYGYRPGKPGLGLVETVENADNRRKKVFFLTPQGRALVAELEAILSADLT
ncbi:MarR family winged helix-turn-helix transcriptional regulator, partial [Rhizobiaceae sp. 2RAB30]